MLEMRKYGSFLIVILILPLVLAQENVSQDIFPDPGITPDSFLWGVDKALEQISLLITFNPEAKAVKGLEIARERLMEVKVMAEEKNLPALEKAQKGHHKALLKVKENVKELEEDNPEELLETELEIEKELLQHREDLEEIKTKLKVKMKIDGELSPEQQEALDGFLATLGESAEEVEIEIKSRKEETKIKIKEKTGKSKEQIEEEVKKREMEKGLQKEKIKVRAEIIGSKVLVNVNSEFETTATNADALLDEIQEKFSLNAEEAELLLKIEPEEETDENTDEENPAEDLGERLKVKVNIEDALAEVEVKLRFVIDYGDNNTADKAAIVNAIAEKTQLTEKQIEAVWKVKENKEKEEKGLKIKVEIEEGEAKVKVEMEDSKMEFVLEETDREKMVQEIAVRLEISVGEVLKFVTFEEETKEPEEEKESRTEEAEDEETDGIKKEKTNGKPEGDRDE